MNIEEQVIYEKLTGKLPISCSFADDQVKENDNQQIRSATFNGENADYFVEIASRIETMERTRENYAFRYIFSCRKYVGKIIVFFKRVIRKLLKWYIEPICFQQTEFNNAVTPAIGRLCELQQRTFDEQIALKKQVENFNEELRQRIETEHAENIRLQKAVENMYTSREEAKAIAEEKISNYEMQLRASSDEIASLTQRLTDCQCEIASQISANGVRLTRIEEQMDDLHGLGIFTNAEYDSRMIRASASQSGEDTIIAYILMVVGRSIPDCTYLDLGANHAKFLSNTFYFYQKGARGVLVEANPNLIGELKLFRSGDVILNRCVSPVGGQSVPFYIMSGDGLSTSDREEAEFIIRENPALYIEKTVEVETITVNELLDKYFDGAPTIMNIDIEGNEMDILHSINFTQHRPLIISVETIPYRVHLVVDEKRTEIVHLMDELGYAEYAFTGINSIFVDRGQIQSN